jgi:hypothetical protein
MNRRSFVLAAALLPGGLAMAEELDYGDMVILDSENLAEQGIKDAYQELLPALRKYVKKPATVTEKLDEDEPSYSVSAGGKDYFIYGGDDQRESWGRATFAFFDIVNRQLEGAPVRFFAINGGNELGGMFLDPARVEKVRKAMKNKSDWPYLPTDKKPWYGMFH